MKKLTIFVVFMALALSLVLSATPVYAVPALPHAFYGSVSINGSPAPPGTSVEARGTGVMTGIQDNPTVTTVTGVYGSSNPFQSRLIVQGEIEEGATITFYVNGVSTGQTAEWHSGQTSEINIGATIAAPQPPGGGGGGGAPTVNLFGVSVSFRISFTGEVLVIITATSADGNLTITIPTGTIALDKDGEPLASLTAAADLSPPDPPGGDTIIGLVYDFGPVGATFNPPLTLTWTYDPDEIPEGAVLMVMEWDDGANEWIEFDGDYTINPDTHTITMLVSHFSKYAIIAHTIPVVTVVKVVPPEPEEEEIVPPEEEEEEVAPPEEEEVEVVVAPPEEEEEAAVTSPPAEKPFNWALFGGIMGGVVVVILIVYITVIRRRTA